MKLFVPKLDDAKQLDAKMQNLLYLTSSGGIWTRSERSKDHSESQKHQGRFTHAGLQTG